VPLRPFQGGINAPLDIHAMVHRFFMPCQAVFKFFSAAAAAFRGSGDEGDELPSGPSTHSRKQKDEYRVTNT
jgi:hypothetical protein